MNRWHDCQCVEPDVYVSSETIFCKACLQQCAPKDVLELSNLGTDGAGSVLSIPPDEPVGQMNLWWPKCVNYAVYEVEKGQSQGSNEPPSNPKTPLGETEVRESLTSNSPTVNSTISKNPVPPTHGKDQSVDAKFHRVERDSLSKDQFRLACLSAVNDINYPVHLTLETYTHGDCPEYEAVSYTWGGEDDESALCRPIFIGAYWDVLLQTKNCWEMLRFVRPWRGIRMLWVDALCINQLNIQERGEQVENMGAIYKECSRVIVYLGPDLAKTTTGFPKRRFLHELQSNRPVWSCINSETQQSVIDLRAILGRRYFSRIWVIQELILSSRAIFRVGDVDYQADSHTWESLAPDWQWTSVTAPWVQYLAQESFRVESVWELMALTSNSKASDPRDRLFGVLNLMSTNLDDGAWKPNYSISARHVFIGFFAHCLLNLKMTGLFEYSLGLPSSAPTWVPSWAWQSFQHKTHNRLHLAEMASDTFSMIRHFNNFTSFHFGWPAHTIHNLSQSIQLKRWYDFATINPHTGSLSVYLTRVCEIDTEVTKFKGPMNRKDLRTFIARRNKSALLFLSRAPLHSVVVPGQDSVFIFGGQQFEENPIFLILRKTELFENWKFVAACRTFAIAHESSTRPSGPQVPHMVLDSSPNLQRNIFQKILGLRAFLEKEITSLTKSKAARSYFPGATKVLDILPLYRVMLGKGVEKSITLSSGFVACIKPAYCASVDDGYISFNFKHEDQELVKDCYMLPLGLYMVAAPDFEFRLNGEWTSGRVTQIFEYDIFNTWGKEREDGVFLRFRASLVQELIDQDPTLRRILLDMDNIQKLLKIDSDELIAICRFGPRESDRFVGCPVGFEALQEYMDIDGSAMRVCIE